MPFWEVWFVLNRAEKNDKYCRILWICRCKCGREQEVLGQSLTTDRSTQCKSCSAQIAGRAGKGKTCPENVRLALIARNYARRGKSLTSEKALASVRVACQKMNEVRHNQAKHILSNVDATLRVADCHLCGRVPVKAIVHKADRWNHLRNQYLCWVGTLNRTDRKGVDAAVSYPNQALEMWNTQRGDCALCGKPMVMAGNASDGATLDHCHTTGDLRGFIHQGCNKGLGHFFDDPMTLRKAAVYLETHQQRS